MHEMNFVIYGIKVTSPILLPLLFPSKTMSDQVVQLNIKNSIDQSYVLEFCTPISEIHGRKIQLSSNIPLETSRLLEERCWRLNIEKLFTFNWCNISNTITIEYNEILDLQKLSFWLLHTVIPIYLTLKQSSLLLHASVVEVGNKAISFIAPSFGGKSTLADFFVKQKHLLLSDDKVRLELRKNNFFVFPSYPYRRPYREFEKLGNYTEYFSHKPLPLGNIYLLNYVDPQDDCHIESIVGLHKFEVLKNAYLYEPVSVSKIEMECLLQLVHHSTVYQVNIPKDITRLSLVYQMIIDHSTNGKI